MIAITDVKIVDTGSGIELWASDENYKQYSRHFIEDDTHPALRPEYERFREEIVQGRIFVNDYGQPVIIGATNVVEETIGIVFKNVDRLRWDVDELKSANANLSVEIHRYKNMSFWERLKWAFINKN